MTILIPGQEPSRSKLNPVYARSGWLIPQENPAELGFVFSIEQMRLRARELMSKRSNLRLRSVSPYPYNCVGMIFAARRAFINIDFIYDILSHDGYQQIVKANVRVGDIVLYRDIENQPVHIALITTIEKTGNTLNIKVISKWGLDPEFEHFEDDVPQVFGRPIEYWTERQE